MSEFTEVLEGLEAALASGENFALATVVAARGSTYRRPGARLLVRTDGTTAGSISGGCLESEIEGVALEVMASGDARLLTVDHSHEDDAHLGWGMGCRGVVEVLVEAAGSAAPVAEALRASRFSPVTLSTDPATAAHVVGEVREGWFVERMEPPPGLLVCGDGPEARPIAEAGAVLGWDITSVVAAQELPVVTERTSAVVCSHNFERDLAFLRALLPSDAAYVGVLGPRSRGQRLVEELGGDIGRIHAPAGLDLGAETPEEIAQSVVAEILAVLNGKSGRPLRDREGPIH